MKFAGLTRRLLSAEQAAAEQIRREACNCPHGILLYHCVEEVEAMIRMLTPCPTHVVPGAGPILFRPASFPLPKLVQWLCCCSRGPMREYREGEHARPTDADLAELGNRETEEEFGFGDAERNRLFQESVRRFDLFEASYLDAVARTRDLRLPMEERVKLWDWVRNGGKDGFPFPRGEDRSQWRVNGRNVNW